VSAKQNPKPVQKKGPQLAPPRVFAFVLHNESSDEGEQAVDLLWREGEGEREGGRERGHVTCSGVLMANCALVMLSTMLIATFFLCDRGRNDNRLRG